MITLQEQEILKIIKEEKSGTSLDTLYSRIYAGRILNRSWLVKNALKRLEMLGLIKIVNNRVFVVEG